MKGKEIRIYDLANKMRISSTTVSRALKEDPLVSLKTTKKIFQLAEEIGYRANYFAGNLRAQKAHII